MARKIVKVITAVTGDQIVVGEAELRHAQEHVKHKPKIFFHPIEGSAPVSVSWYPGPYGDAHESKEGNGVYFTSPNGELLSVQFDDVNEQRDTQTLTAKGVRVSITVKSGKVTVKVVPTSKRVA